ncbi:MAG: CRISPR-associated protein Cas4 [Bacteroidia bacterium]|nr:CRISPR-associated protein Cas4 [Bacteroidia bacterium]
MLSITPSHIIQYLYCPRFIWYEHVLKIPQNEEQFQKVLKGREIHDQKLERNKEYLRKKIGVKGKWVDQYLSHGELRGKVDEVLLLENGKMAPLDYKFAEFKGIVFETYKQQLFCYSLLIEEVFETKVESGYIVYTRSKHHLEEITIKDSDKKGVKESIEGISKIVEKNRYPESTRVKKRCVDCTYRNICPK